MRITLPPYASDAVLGLYCVSLAPIRDAAYCIARQRWSHDGSWAYRDGTKGSRDCLSDLIADPATIYIEPLHLHDPISKDPKAWIESQLTRIFGDAQPVDWK